jgi:hypothetical protein
VVPLAVRGADATRGAESCAASPTCRRCSSSRCSACVLIRGTRESALLNGVIVITKVRS